jgi:hypothetical protein
VPRTVLPVALITLVHQLLITLVCWYSVCVGVDTVLFIVVLLLLLLLLSTVTVTTTAKTAILVQAGGVREVLSQAFGLDAANSLIECKTITVSALHYTTRTSYLY